MAVVVLLLSIPSLPAHGRFLQVDPVGYHDDINDYLYAHDDPANGTDPSGMVELDLISGRAEAERDPEIVRAGSVFTLGPQYFTILAHGDENGIVNLRNGKSITSARQIYELMRAGGYKTGQIPVFLSCNLGNSPIPQELAEITGTPVYGAQGYSTETELDRAGASDSTIYSVRFDAHSGRNGKGENKPYRAFSPQGSHANAADIDSMTVNHESGMATIHFAASSASRIHPPDKTICVDPTVCGGRKK